jgi:Secretion system C-terminal sorting domain
LVGDATLETSGAITGIYPYESNSNNQPNEFALNQNYPNPFNPSTRIQYQVSSISQVIVKVFDVLGNEVTTLVNEEKSAGIYEVEFNANELTSGIYFYKMQTGSFVETKKMILIK